ncbi:hypothetical protein Q1695_002579 [Nippostrongylus brasiliensis]|nr:hypothetical protein Q1695_002579 [Nippostrongylus brasiliensis]
MGEVNFTVHKIKYDKEWDYPSTRKWMEKAWNEVRRQCEAATRDYQRFDENEFTLLEEFISSYVFEMNSEIAERALKFNNILKAFGDPERRFAVLLRKKLEEAGGSKTVDVQVVPVLALMDDKIGKEDASSSQIVVFRVKTSGGGFKFVDCALRIYNSWDNYLTTNKTPQCMMCYPVDGFLRAQRGRNFVASDVHFGEPYSCTLEGRTLKNLDKICVFASSAVAVTMFWTPVGWIASALSAISGISLSYSLLRQVMNIVDKKEHGESYGADIFHFATMVATLAASRMIPMYLGFVQRQNRQLYVWESTIITWILRGMAAITAVNATMLLYQFGCKLVEQPTEVSALDVVNLVIAAQNMFSWSIKPISAKALLVKVITEIKDKYKSPAADKESEKPESQAEHKSSAAGKEKKDVATQTENKSFAAGKESEKPESQAKHKSSAADKESEKPESQAKHKSSAADKESKAKELQEENKVLLEKLRDLKRAPRGNEVQINELMEQIRINDMQVRLWRVVAVANVEKFLEIQRNRREMEVKEVMEPIQERQQKIKMLEDGNAKMWGELNNMVERELELKMTKNDDDMNKLTCEVLKMQNTYLKDKGDNMTDEGAQKRYREFVRDKQNNRGTNRIVDQNNRIIETVTVMDAEQVFKLISVTQSKICFANGETIDLLINNQFEVSPRAIDQMNRFSVRATNNRGVRTEETKNDLEEVMRITKQFDENQMDRNTYLKSINDVLQKYQMITRKEISVVTEELRERSANLSEEIQNMLRNMKPTMAFRMRTVLKGTAPGDLEAAVKIAEKIAELEIAAISATSVADCVEIVKLHFRRKMEVVEQERNLAMAGAGGAAAASNVYVEHFGLSEADMNVMNNDQVSKRDKLTQRFAENIINNDAHRAEIVNHINARIAQIGEFARTEQLFHGSLLSAYYHVEKHFDLTVSSYYKEIGRPVPDPLTQQQIDDVYFSEMKNLLFNEKNYRRSLISQDGHTRTRIWAMNNKYTGYSKADNPPASYSNLLDGNIASHFQK